jgi:hypothetical protein
MTANELADELEYACKIAEPRITMMERMKLSATMLRQQQAEIAELKHMNRNWQISENILLLELEKLQHCELTDEEITACIDESEPDTADMIRFAKAILRKASEK